MKLREYKRLLKSISSILIVLMTTIPVLTYANNLDVKAVSKEAKDLGLELLNHSNELDVNTNDLYPSNLDSADLGTLSIDELKKLYTSGSGEELDAAGGKGRSSLWEDANSENPSIMGAAYKIVMDAANRSRPDFDNDPILQSTKHIYDEINLITAGFQDCSSDKVINNIDTINHIPDYQNCDRLTYNSGECTATHQYDAVVLSHHAGPYNLNKCGEDCIELWIGRVGDNYWRGKCTIYEEYTQVKVDNPEALTKATLTYAKWDDYMQVLIGEPGKETLVWQGPNKNFPPETEGKCELSTSWSKKLDVDVTEYFKGVKPGTVISFKIRVSVTGAGEGFGKVILNYDKNKAIVRDEWLPKKCVDQINGVLDGFANGSYVCTQMPILDANGCTVINGVTVCNNMLKSPPFPDVSPLCQSVVVATDYSFYKGSMDCWIDSQGEKQCPVIDGESKNEKCSALENDSKCGFISSECVEGAKGQSGNCYLFTDTYDCGEDIIVPDKNVSNNYVCDGEISCMGGDCLDYDALDDTTSSYAKAVGLLNVAQFMTQDMNCEGTDENGNVIGDRDVICKIFGGKAGECKIAVGGISDCCEKPSGISLNDYMTLIMATPKLDGALMSLDDANMIKGGYQVIRNAATATWDAVSQPFASYIENISGAVDYVTTAIEDFVNEIMDQIKSKLKDIIVQVVEDSTGEAMAESAASEAASEMMGYASAALSTIMMVYSIYVIAIALIKIIWKCEDDEFEMNAKRQLKNCAYVGSYCKTKVLGACIEKREAYCCYNSPLSRIIQEQVRKANPQLGLSFGSTKHPTCDGLLISDIAELDWSKVDLSEWLAILEKTGYLNNENTMNLDKLTGSGSTYNITGDRLNSEERAVKRFNDSNATEVNKKIIDSIDLNTGAPAQSYH